MAEQARVDSTEALDNFKRAIWKFQELANVALGESESELIRTINWLENEARSHWAGQLRKGQELVARAKEALRMKQLFPGPAGTKQSVVDEMKALRRAQQKLEIAEQKVVAVRKATLQLQKELMVYKGQVQHFATSIASDLPQAAHDLNAIVEKLEQYAAGGYASGVTEAVSQVSADMRRTVEEKPVEIRLGEDVPLPGPKPHEAQDEKQQAQPPTKEGYKPGE
ncbi:MAG: hypothetical protein IT448_04520 [Phycisphaerales bacterium]|nr:hypothetical protein [Phycisphaerales bacterium]